MSSRYLAYQAQVGRAIPFPPPVPSPKNTHPLTAKQHLYLLGWRAGLRLAHPWVGRRAAGWRPVFPVGCHNSGTTILADLIARHPAIVNWSEAPEVWAPDNAFLSWGILPEPTAAQPFLFDPLAYERDPQTHAAALPWIRSVFGLFALSRGRRRFLNKNPHMTINVPYLAAAFPAARYVYIRRNGYAVVQSLLSNWRPVLESVRAGTASGTWAQLREALPAAYFDDSLAWVRRCAAYWCEMDDHAARDLAALPAEQVYSTDYETLCAAPGDTLRAILQHCGLDPARYPWATMPALENRNYKYRERLTAAEIDTITEVAGAHLARYGYLHAAPETG